MELAIPAILLGTTFGAAGVQAGGGSARVSLGLIAGAATLAATDRTAFSANT